MGFFYFLTISQQYFLPDSRPVCISLEAMALSHALKRGKQKVNKSDFVPKTTSWRHSIPLSSRNIFKHRK